MFVTLLFVLSSIYAQTEYSVYEYGHFRDGSSVYLFGDNVNVRETPSINAKIVKTLPIAYPVEIISKSETMYTLNDFTAHWYNVRFECEGEEIEGYVWGGLMSVVTLPLGSNGADDDGLFLFGITEQEKAFFSGEGRVVKNGKIISKTDFEIIGSIDPETENYDHSISGKLLDNSGFASLENIIVLSFLYEACGYTNGDILLFWNGKQLTYGTIGISVSEAGVFHDYFDFYLPNHIDGTPNYLIHIQSYDEYGEGCYERVETNIRLYHWNGKKLKRVTENSK